MLHKIKLLAYIIPLIFFIGLAIFLWRGLGENPHELPSALINKPAPAFSEADLKNPKQMITNNIFKGHVSLLNVWATWCLSCRAEHPILMDIADSKKVVLYGVDYKDQRQPALQWLQQNGNPYQKVIFDPQGNLGINYGVYGTPETFVIDKKGIIRYKYIGPISPMAWKDDILPEVEKLSS